MKKIISLLLAVAFVFCFAACDKAATAEKKERKRAEKGQNTIVGSQQENSSSELETGLMTALDKSYAQSNKAGVTYDANVFMNIVNKSSGKVKIACLGDSITFGSLASNPEKTSYPAVLQQQLVKKYGNKFEVKNYGHSGSYVADFGRSNAATLRYCNTAEYRQLKKDKPDAVIIMLGINDIGYITSKSAAEEFCKAYSEILKELSSLPSKPVIYVCTPLVRTTAYSSYINMSALRTAEIAAANVSGAYVIDTYNLTLDYFGSHLYETDGLHPNDDGYKYLADTIYNAVALGYTSFAKKPVKATPDYVVYVDSSKGSDSSVGASAAKPVASLARAVDLCKGGGTVVVSGPVTPATTGMNQVKVFIAPENSYKITVTSIDPYNGTDYRNTNGAKIFHSASFYMNGDYEFKNIDFEMVASGVKIVCNYHNVTFGAGITTTVAAGGYPVLILGHDTVSALQTDSDLDCSESCTLTVNSGKFAYFRGGNFRTVSDTGVSYAYGTVKKGVTVNIAIGGGTFTNEESTTNYKTDSARLCSALGQNGMEAGSNLNLTINGGTLNGAVYAVPRLNPYYTGGLPQIAGKITVNVAGGALIGSGIEYLETYPGGKKPNIKGEYALNITGGAFAGSSKKILSATGCANATLTLSSKYGYMLNWATVSGFKTINK